MQSIYLSMSAWREILAQTLGDSPAQDNVSPAWLVNPATRRRLKLDRYYPDIRARYSLCGANGQRPKAAERLGMWKQSSAIKRGRTVSDEWCSACGY
ncbi:MAG: hypothetical protein R3A44_13740 [Caldilineaceae bacterium]